MGERAELNKQHSEWLNRRQEAESKLKELEPKAVDLSRGEKPRQFNWTPEKQEKIDEVTREIEEATRKLREMEEKLKKLPKDGS